MNKPISGVTVKVRRRHGLTRWAGMELGRPRDTRLYTGSCRYAGGYRRLSAASGFDKKNWTFFD
jgi:hypothetical protein